MGSASFRCAGSFRMMVGCVLGAVAHFALSTYLCLPGLWSQSQCSSALRVHFCFYSPLHVLRTPGSLLRLLSLASTSVLGDASSSCSGAHHHHALDASSCLGAVLFTYFCLLALFLLASLFLATAYRHSRDGAVGHAALNHCHVAAPASPGLALGFSGCLFPGAPQGYV